VPQLLRYGLGDGLINELPAIKADSDKIDPIFRYDFDQLGQKTKKFCTERRNHFDFLFTVSLFVHPFTF